MSRLNLIAAVERDAFSLKNSLFAVLSSFCYSRKTHPLDSESHGCSTLHFAKNRNEHRAKSFKPTLPNAGYRMKGFTLIEVLVALAVVSGVFLLVLTSFSYHIDIFDRKKDSLKLVLQAKENLYLYKTGKLIELAGTKDGVQYEVTTEDMEYQMKKVISRARSGKDEALLLEYMRK